MSRETKQDRLVRSIYDNVYEHLHELKNLQLNPTTKEADVERWCQSVLRSCLGFASSNGYSIRAQETKGKMRPDLVILKNDSPIIVIEVKKLDFDLNKSEFRSGKTQLSQYLSQLGNVKWGILCNGFEWKLFDFSSLSKGGIEVLSIDLRNDGDEIELSKREIEDKCWELLDFHEHSYMNDSWYDYSREATAFSPDSLAKAILSHDVVKHIAKAIRGEHEYKANLEVLTDEIYNLLNLGLDDSIVGWNEVKQAEMQKFIKAQKRQSRKRKLTVKSDENLSQDTAGVSLSNPITDSSNEIFGNELKKVS